MIVETESAKLRRRLFLSAVLSLWDRGMDTDQIARTLGEDQAGIERTLHEALEKRRRQRHETKATDV